MRDVKQRAAVDQASVLDTSGSEPLFGPTDEDIRYVADLCQCIGYVVVHWSLIENQLDNCVNVTFHNCGGSQFRKGTGVPRSLKQKLVPAQMLQGPAAPYRISR